MQVLETLRGRIEITPSCENLWLVVSESLVTRQGLMD